MLQDNIETYLASLRIANLSPNTIRSYQQALDSLALFVGPEADVRDIDVSVMRTYISVLAKGGLSPNSRNHALATFKAFGKFLFDEDILDDNVFEVMPRAKVPLRLPELPTLQTVTALLDGEMPTIWPARDHALLELLYCTGVRATESANIMLTDLRSDGLILIRGKGDKERLVPMRLASPPRKALDVYMADRARKLRKLKRESSALFFSISRRTKFKEPEPLDVRSVWRILHDACIAKGIAPLHPHQLRHACATHMLDNGASLVVIQKLLGHTKLSTTALYAFVSTGLMQRTYNLHPSCRVA